MTRHLQKGRRTYADVAQMVERIHGKDEVTGSIPVVGSRVGTEAVKRDRL